MEAYEKCLKDSDLGAVKRTEALAGGSINEVKRLHLESGESLIVKTNRQGPRDLFLAEADSLQALAAVEAIRIPHVLHASEDFLLLEDLGSQPPGPGFHENLGQQLAQLHSHQQPVFGFSRNNYCGATPQDNSNDADGFRFFGERRLLALAKTALERGLLSKREMDQVATVAGHLERWIPRMPATLIHGDLWSGNVHCDRQGQPALIDPATYWGWAEAELAMTELFGGFPPAFYASYEAVSGVNKDWRDRTSLYNLYHLLNHLLLFGSSYHHSVQAVLDRYAD